MTVVEYETYFPAPSRYFYDSISIESENTQKFVKGLDVSLQLAMSQMVVLRVFFQSIMDHAKMTEGIIYSSQGGANKGHHFCEFRGQHPHGRDFCSSCGQCSPMQVALQSSGVGPSSSAVQSGRSGLLLPFPIGQLDFMVMV